MTYFISIDEIKQNNVINANVDTEYIEPALREAQDIFLREILGDALYNAIENRINDNNLTGKYVTLVNQYIKPYLENRMLASLVVPLAMKIRNAGVIQQYDQGFNQSSVKDVNYLADYYNNRVEFYENRMTEYLKKNAADFPEYGYSSENITNPTQTHTAGTIYLGGGRKHSCGLKTGSGGGSTDRVEWNDIQNKPNFATVATSGSYNDLQNRPNFASVAMSGSYIDLQDKPKINNATLTIRQGGTVKGTFSANASENVDINLESGGGGSVNWNDIRNKPDFATVATSGSYTDLNNKPTIPTKTSELTNDSGFTTFDGDYNSLTNKPTIPTVNNATLTIKQGGTTKGTFTANAGTDVEINLESGGGGGSTDWNDITNKPNFATVATSGSYNDLSDIPYYFNYLSENMSSNGVKLAGQTQFDELTTDITYGVQLPFKVDAAQIAKVYTDYIITGENTGGASELIIEGDDGGNVYGKITKDGIYEGTDKLSDKYLQIANLPTNVSAFTNDAGYLTQHQSLAGYATENWVQQQGYSTFSGSYNDLSDKPSIPAAQVQSDWNAVSGMGQILNKPSLATVATSGDYNDLQNKPTIPAAQVQSDWNANSGMGEILNKPSMTAETWTFTVDDGQGGTTTVTKTVWLQ